MYNKVTIVGRIATEIETREFGSNQVSKFSIAVNDNYAKEKTAYFFDVEVWNSSSKYLEKFGKKGARILVDGALKSTTYENKDGNKVKRVFINANQVSLFDYESKEETTTEIVDNYVENSQTQENGDDDLPF